MIVPNARFNCNGRITNVAVSMTGWFGSNAPLLQIWHPTSLNSSNYTIIGEIQLPGGSIGNVFSGYYYINMSLNSISQIEFQLGDVIGYHQPSNARRFVRSIQTSEYISYSNNTGSPLTSIDINNVDNVETDRQPLIEITFGKLSDQVFKIYS